MKKLATILSALLLICSAASAQETFFPGWQFGIKGGAGLTVGETNDVFNYLVSPAGAIDAGYQFTPTFTLRADLSGWQGRAYLPQPKVGYTFNYVQLAIDGAFDLCNMFGGYKTRAVNPYLFLGVGANLAFNNGCNPDYLQDKKNYWKNHCFGPVGRIGFGIDFRLCDAVAIELEAVENCLMDTFNSKVGDLLDHQIDALVGLKFSFGQAKAKKSALAASEAAAAASAAAAAAAAAAADKALEDAIAAANQAIDNALAAMKANDFCPKCNEAIKDAIFAVKLSLIDKDVKKIEAATKELNDQVAKCAQKKSEAEKAAADKAAAELAAADAAKAQAGLDAIDASKKAANNIYYNIGKSVIRADQQNKINRLVKTLKNNPEASVVICGFADKFTGNSSNNMVLSENRAKSVVDALVAAGIDESRIKAYWFGDTIQVSETPDKNRVSVVVCK